ncbi:MAG: decaprenyl-phosphate phosphoribosyltransferase [Prevotella sp.]|jgi:decaprenyl-phosphate phosphoribosyltransferase|nr:decaprenyl-phosphate phosphoribosyltransferase [Prevotella sp.]MBP6527120.1 decaprenyl-phosphate phosphoribosyltransferase [Prevotella sp.]MBP7097181.1 decaprenyl-phosphate phosphoribosyltransferase [Prevotella sp.]MBP8686037.1 decaprenyl-phosphate phosphoribosyltransferase [Prevotella sp.]MBP8935589.1 decaprenyl-phosphate phosphoribosyltransferase [Prevotella sp.]MBP9984509.1 decaprenyl-phosphate phosphoribosyltransferase [Prevotella sp.]
MDSKAYLNLIRPKQWIKNLFVMVPLFFGGALFDFKSLIAGAITFIAYSFAASSIYCFNDIHDVDDDRRHPAKCHRPVASGAVSIFQAYVLMALMILLSMICIIFLPENKFETGGVILFYWVLNIAYCAKLKRYAIVDVCIVAFGFVLRLFAGGFASDILLSKWIVLMTFLITLFMSFAKRRDDVLRMEETGEAPRRNTIRYNLTFINQAITITASVTLVCYIMYTVSPEVIENFHTDYLYLTSVFVLLGLLRYIQLAVVDKESGDPTKIILKDHFTQLIVFAWLVSFIIIIYVFKR